MNFPFKLIRDNPGLILICLDMDGTLARFYERAKCVEKFHEEAFFLLLRAYENFVTAIKNMLDKYADKIVFCVLSAADGEQARADKTAWNKKEISPDIPMVYCNFGQSKAEVIESLIGRKLTDKDILIDDYSKNLIDWEEHGGKAVKFLNELNGRGWNGHNFVGDSISYDKAPEELESDILRIIGIDE